MKLAAGKRSGQDLGPFVAGQVVTDYFFANSGLTAGNVSTTGTGTANVFGYITTGNTVSINGLTYAHIQLGTITYSFTTGAAVPTGGTATIVAAGVPTTAGGWNTYWIEDGVKHEWQTVYDTTASVASLGSISIAIVAPVNGNWTNTNSGTSSWSTASNWNGGVPTALGDTATFGAALTSGTATVTLDGSRTLSGLTFSNTNGSYAIAAGTGGTLTLAGTGGASAAPATAAAATASLLR